MERLSSGFLAERTVRKMRSLPGQADLGTRYAAHPHSVLDARGCSTINLIWTLGINLNATKNFGTAWYERLRGEAPVSGRVPAGLGGYRCYVGGIAEQHLQHREGHRLLP